MECKFVVGQKAVCLKDDWVDWLTHVELPIGSGPVKGDICTITVVRVSSFGVVLSFKEWAGADHEYDYRAFRPLQDRPKEADTDISVFHPALKVKETEPV